MTAVAHIEGEAEKIRRGYIADPVRFSVDILGREPWDDGSGESQTDILRAAPSNLLMAVRSGHKVGKTGTIGILSLWAYACFHPSSVILTAPTHRQVQRVVWKEITKLYRGARHKLGGRLYESATAGLRHPAGNEVFGLSTDDPDRFSGFSGENVFYMVDEAPGVAEEIFDAINGNRAGGSSLWTFGNPTQISGTFFEAFHGQSDIWRTFHISSERVAAMNALAKIPGLATQQWVIERQRAWRPHETHPMYAIRVDGRFPPGGLQNVVKLSSWKKARARYDRMTSRYRSPRELHFALMRKGYGLTNGLDVARFGDDSNVLTSRRGPLLISLATMPSGDSEEVAGWGVGQTRMHVLPGEGTIPGTRKPRMNVDAIGVGAGVYDFARKQSHVDVGALVTSERSDQPDEYHNLRSQLWFNMDRWLNEVGAVPDNNELRVECLAPRYKFDVSGRLQVEQKLDTKKRLQRSPDRADSLMLSTYDGASYTVGQRRAGLRVADL